MTNSDRLQEIRERAEKATPGPWEPTDEEFSDCRKADQYFIAEARSDIPWLLVTKQQREIDRLKNPRKLKIEGEQNPLEVLKRTIESQGFPQAKEQE